MQTPSTLRKPEEFPDTLLGQWVRLKFNPTNIYYVKSVLGYTIAFSLTTGHASMMEYRPEELLGVYKNPIIPQVPSIYVPSNMLRPGDIAKELTDDRWFLVGLYKERNHKLYLNGGALPFPESDYKDYCILSKCNLTFRWLHG